MSSNRSTIITIGVIALILIGVAVYTFVVVGKNSGHEAGSEAERVFSGSSAEKLATLSGEPVDLDQYDGMVQVVNAWATWCPFCKNELPDFETLANEYKDQNVVVLAINRKEDPRRAQAFVESVGGLDSIVFLSDPDDHFYTSTGGFSMPETIFYDTRGNVVVHKRGVMTLDEMRKHVAEALRASE